VSIEARLPSVSLRSSLRAKIALGVALPVFLMLASLSLLHYWRERHLLDAQLQIHAQQTGELVLGSLRHAMMINDALTLQQALVNVIGMSGIQRVQVIGADGQVKADVPGRDAVGVADLDRPGCAECHQLPIASRPSTVRLSGLTDVLRITTPIPNEAACEGCHAQGGGPLGVLHIDVSLAGIEPPLLNDLRVDLLFAAGVTVLFTLGLYVMIHRLVVRRVGAMRPPLAELAAGNLGARLPLALNPTDEIDALSAAVNLMAVELQRNALKQQELSELRQRAIVEERERIGRELHDGLAQLLGYVNTKAMAVRLMLKNDQREAAEQHVLQLEEAAQALFVDVREAILGLKASGQADGRGDGLAVTLSDYVAQFSRLCGIPVSLDVSPEFRRASLPAEAEVQLLRIVQEALTNVRKHAPAGRAAVSLQVRHGALELTVRDDGAGFQMDTLHASNGSHFGLRTMRERAEAIGAQFALDSNPGRGTRVLVKLNLEGTGYDARIGSG
jgi:signal transduction histidine kinase